MNNELILQTIGGFGNRIRFVFSWYLHAKKHNQTLKVYWPTDSECNGFYLDYFEQVSGIEFINDVAPKNNKAISSFHWHKDFEPWNYNLLKPIVLRRKMQNLINNYIHRLGKYCAIHIRQTDFSIVQKKCNIPILTNEDFYQKLLNTNIHMYQNIYLATDNFESQQYFKSKLNEKLVYYSEIIPDLKNKRQTSLEHAIIDIYVCSLSDKFIETPVSSFSSLVNQFRKYIFVNSI